MSAKDSTEQWTRSNPVRALAVVGAVALVIGLLGGAALGYKIEQSRTQSDTKRLKAQIAKLKSTPKRATTPAEAHRTGTVAAVAAGTLAISNSKKQSIAVKTSALTKYFTVTKGSRADLVAGRRVLVTPHGGEFLVLVTGSLSGRPIVKVTSDAVQLTAANGLPAGKPAIGAGVVDVAQKATAADVKTGSSVLVIGKAQGSTFVAASVFVLPAGSRFAS